MTVTPDLLSSRLLARNTLINLAGEVLPFLVGIFTIPILVHGIGVARYGTLTLSAMAIGYFGLFDLGLGAAATKLIAEALGGDERAKIPNLFWTSLFLMFGFGACGAFLLVGSCSWLIEHLFRIPPSLRPEALHAFYLLALSLPFVISTASLRGTLAAFQRFDLINTVRVPAGIFSYVGPLLVLPFSHGLGYLVGIMVVGRLAEWAADFSLCLRIFPELWRERNFSSAAAAPMLRFGGWVTVSNIVSPIMVYFDRFVIASVISMAAVAYYAVPYQLASKMWIVAGAFQGVVFAAFSGGIRQDPERTVVLFERALLLLLIALFPLVLAIVALAPEGLRLWLGPQFSLASTGVLRWLAMGIFVNSLAWIPYSLVVASYRPDLTAKLHLAEMPFYCLFLWIILRRDGVEGVAIAWTLRALIDAAALFFMAWRLVPAAGPAIGRSIVIIALAAIFPAAAFACRTLAVAVPFLIIVMAFAACLIWTVLLREGEKRLLRGYVQSFRALASGAVK